MLEISWLAPLKSTPTRELNPVRPIRMLEGSLFSSLGGLNSCAESGGARTIRASRTAVNLMSTSFKGF